MKNAQALLTQKHDANDHDPNANLHIPIDLIQKPPTIILVKDPGKPPRLMFEGLHIMNLHEQHVTRLGALDLERPGQVVHGGQVDVQHVLGAVVVFDLAAGPVDAFDLDGLAVFDRAAEGDCSEGGARVSKPGSLVGGRRANVLSGCHRLWR